MKTNKYRTKGFIAVLVLCVTASLAVILLVFNNKYRRDLKKTEDFRDNQQALCCAESGVNIAAAYIKNIRDGNDGEIDDLTSEEKVFELENGNCSIKIIGESSKINVNMLIDKNGNPDRDRIDQFLRLIDLLNQKSNANLNISYGLVPAVIDWIDKDDDVVMLSFISGGNSGAESDYYNQLSPSYSPANSEFNSPRELLPVKHMNPSVFKAIRNYLTVYGNGKININYAPEFVIESLSEKMSSSLAQLIMNRRKSEAFKSISDIRNVPGMTDDIYQDIKDMLTVNEKDKYYTVVSRGRVKKRCRTIYAVLNINTESKRIKIPFYEQL